MQMHRSKQFDTASQINEYKKKFVVLISRYLFKFAPRNDTFQSMMLIEIGKCAERKSFHLISLQIEIELKCC
jgi:hypothetical protein